MITSVKISSKLLNNFVNNFSELLAWHSRAKPVRTSNAEGEVAGPADAETREVNRGFWHPSDANGETHAQ
jgi:hypothetical protein